LYDVIRSARTDLNCIEQSRTFKYILLPR
jgi:hypothetical protein